MSKEQLAWLLTFLIAIFVASGVAIVVVKTADDETYLRLDATNDPVGGPDQTEGTLGISRTVNVETADEKGLDVRSTGAVLAIAGNGGLMGVAGTSEMGTGVVGTGGAAGVLGMSTAAAGVGVSSSSTGDNATAISAMTRANVAADSTNYQVLQLQSFIDDKFVKTVVRQSKVTAPSVLDSNTPGGYTTLDKISIEESSGCLIEARIVARTQAANGPLGSAFIRRFCYRPGNGNVDTDDPGDYTSFGDLHKHVNSSSNPPEEPFVKITSDNNAHTVMMEVLSGHAMGNSVDVVWSGTISVYYHSN